MAEKFKKLPFADVLLSTDQPRPPEKCHAATAAAQMTVILLKIRTDQRNKHD